MEAWKQAADAYLAAADLYAETMRTCWMAGADAMIESMQSGMAALPQAAAGMRASDHGKVAEKPAPAVTSWYRPPVENPYLTLVDDALKPWRTMIPDHSGHPQHLSEGDLFTPKGAAEILAAYHSGSGFTMTQISFPDEKSVCVTMPAPWAFLSAR